MELWCLPSVRVLCLVSMVFWQEHLIYYPAADNEGPRGVWTHMFPESYQKDHFSKASWSRPNSCPFTVFYIIWDRNAAVASCWTLFMKKHFVLTLMSVYLKLSQQILFCVCVCALSQKHQPLSIDREDQWKPNTDCTNDHVMDEVSLWSNDIKLWENQ